jgi:DNA-binding NarL/FixJ family response regulator
MGTPKPKRAAGGKLRSKAITRILIVDDHALLREGLKELLSSEPDLEPCGEAAGETEAMELVRSTAPDLVIIDMTLEQGNGLDLIKRIKAHDASIRMIVCSMHDDSLYAERALRAGASGYVNKQAPAPTILKAIAEVREGGVFLNAPLTRQLLRSAAGMGDDPPKSVIESFSDRELQVFGMIGQGLTTGQIAKQLHLSARTVETYRERLKTKLNLKHAAELNRDAAQFCLLQSRQN